MPFVVKKTVSGIKPFLIMLLIALLLGWIPIGFASDALFKPPLQSTNGETAR